MKKRFSLFVILTSVLALCIVICTFYFSSASCKTIQVATTGYYYDSSNDNVAEQCSIVVDGLYYSSLLHVDSFTGRISIDSETIVLNDKIIELSFINNIAVPITEDESGRQYTSRIHSVIRETDSDALIILLYNEYNITDDSLTADINRLFPVFICVGQISKDTAQELIYSYYEK